MSAPLSSDREQLLELSQQLLVQDKHLNLSKDDWSAMQSVVQRLTRDKDVPKEELKALNQKISNILKQPQSHLGRLEALGNLGKLSMIALEKMGVVVSKDAFRTFLAGALKNGEIPQRINALKNDPQGENYIRLLEDIKTNIYTLSSDQILNFLKEEEIFFASHPGASFKPLAETLIAICPKENVDELKAKLLEKRISQALEKDSDHPHIALRELRKEIEALHLSRGNLTKGQKHEIEKLFGNLETSLSKVRSKREEFAGRTLSPNEATSYKDAIRSALIDVEKIETRLHPLVGTAEGAAFYGKALLARAELHHYLEGSAEIEVDAEKGPKDAIIARNEGHILSSENWIRKNVEEITSLQTEITKLQEEISDAEKTIAEELAKAEKLESIPNTLAGTTFAVIQQENQETIKDLQERVDLNRKVIDQKTFELSSLFPVVESLTNTNNSLRETITSIIVENERLIQPNAEQVEEGISQSGNKSLFEIKASQIKNLIALIKKNDGNLSDLQAELVRLEQKIATIAEVDKSEIKAYSDLKNKIDGIKNEIESLTKGNARLQRMIDQLQDELKTIGRGDILSSPPREKESPIAFSEDVAVLSAMFALEAERQGIPLGGAVLEQLQAIFPGREQLAKINQARDETPPKEVDPAIHKFSVLTVSLLAENKFAHVSNEATKLLFKVLRNKDIETINLRKLEHELTNALTQPSKNPSVIAKVYFVAMKALHLRVSRGVFKSILKPTVFEVSKQRAVDLDHLPRDRSKEGIFQNYLRALQKLNGPGSTPRDVVAFEQAENAFYEAFPTYQPARLAGVIYAFLPSSFKPELKLLKAEKVLDTIGIDVPPLQVTFYQKILRSLGLDQSYIGLREQIKINGIQSTFYSTLGSLNKSQDTLLQALHADPKDFEKELEEYENATRATALSLENVLKALKPHVGTPFGAAQYARALAEKIEFLELHEKTLAAVQLLKNDPSAFTSFQEKIGQRMPARQALEEVQEAKTPDLYQAFNQQSEEVMASALKWALFAAAQNNSLGARIASHLLIDHTPIGDRTIDTVFDKALTLMKKALDLKDPSALKEMAELLGRRFIMGQNMGSKDVDGSEAIAAYQTMIAKGGETAAHEAHEGLYLLFLGGSREAGDAMVQAIDKQTFRPFGSIPTFPEIQMLTVAAILGVKGAESLIIKLKDKYPDSPELFIANDFLKFGRPDLVMGKFTAEVALEIGEICKRYLERNPKIFSDEMRTRFSFDSSSEASTGSSRSSSSYSFLDHPPLGSSSALSIPRDIASLIITIDEQMNLLHTALAKAIDQGPNPNSLQRIRDGIENLEKSAKKMDQVAVKLIDSSLLRQTEIDEVHELLREAKVTLTRIESRFEENLEENDRLMEKAALIPSINRSPERALPEREEAATLPEASSLSPPSDVFDFGLLTVDLPDDDQEAIDPIEFKHILEEIEALLDPPTS